MLRALYTAASGMIAHQAQVDTIAHNLANVTTTGFKRGRAEFRDLLYARLHPPLDGQGAATAVGQGVRLSNIDRIISGGALQATGNAHDVAIQGAGYFRILRPDGSEAYTRDGALHQDDKGRIVTTTGDLVLGESGPIRLPPEAGSAEILADGTVRTSDGTTVGRLTLALFTSPSGLSALGDGRLGLSPQAGERRTATPGEEGAGTLVSGHLEASNVEIGAEMVSLMMAQRAYGLNSRLIQSADEMMGMANNIRRG